MYTHVCKTAKRWVDSGVKFLKNVDWKKVGVTVGAIGVGIALTVATGGLGAPAAMTIGGAAIGAIISGYDGYTSGKRGWELVGAIGQGAGVGALTGFVGGHLMGAGAGIATSATQNIRNQAVRHVVKAGIEAGVETAVDTGLDLATGNAVTGQTVAMNVGYNLISNGGGSVSAKKTEVQSAPKTDYSQNRKYWKNDVVFEGNKVYQRDDLIDPNIISSWKDKTGSTITGTNIERMASGKAPIGPDGKPIELHHTTQRQTSSIAETTYTFHKDNSKIIHINPNKIPSGINRNEFGKWRGNYWQHRVKDFID
ncbi:HNH/ENDO VII family nuclease [Streptococcus suis]|uniref:HNH/ENDO VII family nuclease n=1 Tax=Streptococcus suis TaxID=1307 RepID=UPI000416B4A7|nr:HNH/ENDO VII family nuclease [Streptococcus suis]